MASLPLPNERDEQFEAFQQRVEANRPALKAAMENAIQAFRSEPTAEERERLTQFIRWVKTEKRRMALGLHPTAEEMLREDRNR